MKQFLRYQISGMVFIAWVLIFYYGSQTETTLGLARKISEHNINFAFGGFLSALPIGVLIHQFSVLLKNWVLAKMPCYPHFSDKPGTFSIEGLKSPEDKDYTQYLLERVSNLNTFYYVRVDNGLLAPVLALLFCSFFLDVSLCQVTSEIILMVVVAIITLVYVLRISEELKEYQKGLSSNVKIDGCCHSRYQCFKKLCLLVKRVRG